jgi:lipoate-protein ligase A
VERLICRQLPYAQADGPHNMAADEVMLERAVRGIASLRFYGWSAPTLSLGYFQTEKVRQKDPLLFSLLYVRRPSGGEALVHDQELTYALALPASGSWQDGLPAASWLKRAHEVFASALKAFGVPAHLVGDNQSPPGGVLCFQHLTAADLTVGGHKIAGSAQRRQRGALLQHGALLLGTSSHAPQLPGIRELGGQALPFVELVGAIESAWIQEIGWELSADSWNGSESRRVEELVETKYGLPAWNKKR